MSNCHLFFLFTVSVTLRVLKTELSNLAPIVEEISFVKVLNFDKAYWNGKRDNCWFEKQYTCSL